MQQTTLAGSAFILLEVLRRIPRNRWISTQELHEKLAAEGFPVPIRMLQRHLRMLAEEPRAHLEVRTDCRPFLYRLGTPHQGLLVPQLTPKECLILRLAQEHLKWLAPDEGEGELAKLFRTAGAQLDEIGSSDRVPGEKPLSRVAVAHSSMPTIPPLIRPGVFDAVSEALFRGSLLEAGYIKSSDIVEQTKVVSPLGLVQQENRLYLVCQYENYSDFRHLALHRMTRARVLDRPASRPRDFSLENYVRTRHFNFGTGKRVRLSFDFTNSVTASILVEAPFSENQRVMRRSGGLWHYEAELEDSLALDGWIASWRERAGITNVVKTPLDAPKPPQP